MSEPSSAKEIIGTIFWTALLLGLGIWMIVHPDPAFLGDGSNLHRAKSRLFFEVIHFIWGLPGGIVLILLGALIVFGMIKSRRAKPA